MTSEIIQRVRKIKQDCEAKKGNLDSNLTLEKTLEKLREQYPKKAQPQPQPQPQQPVKGQKP